MTRAISVVEANIFALFNTSEPIAAAGFGVGNLAKVRKKGDRWEDGCVVPIQEISGTSARAAVCCVLAKNR